MNKLYKYTIALNILSILLCFFSRIAYFDELFITIELLTLASGIFGFLLLILYPSIRFNFFIVSSCLILLGTSGGLLNTYFTINIYQDLQWINVLTNNNITTENIIDGQAYSNSFCLVFTLLGIRLQKTGMIDIIYEKSKRILYNNSVINLFVIFLFFCQLYLLVTEEVVFGGITSDKLGKASHPLQAFGPLFCVVPFWAAYKIRLILNNKMSLPYIILIVFVCVVNIYWPFLLGRRMLFYFTLLFLAGFYHENIPTLKLLSLNTFIIFFSILLATQLSNLYNKFRLVKGYEYVQSHGINQTLQNLSENEIPDFSTGNMANVSLRSSYNTMTFAYFISLSDKIAHPLYGTSFLNQLLVTTPGDFFVDKSLILTKENLYMDTFSIKLNDISDTVYLEALVDFGIMGIIIYPLLLFFVLVPFYFYSAHIDSRLSLAVGVASSFMALCMIETDTNVFLTMIRIFIVIIIVSRLVSLFTNK